VFGKFSDGRGRLGVPSMMIDVDSRGLFVKDPRMGGGRDIM
jgi:hypothetical protein